MNSREVSGSDHDNLEPDWMRDEYTVPSQKPLENRIFGRGKKRRQKSTVPNVLLL